MRFLRLAIFFVGQFKQSCHVAISPIFYHLTSCAGGVALERDPATTTLHAMRAGPDGWELWVSDTVLLDALRAEVSALGVRRVAYWRLGLEDPLIWR